MITIWPMLYLLFSYTYVPIRGSGALGIGSPLRGPSLCHRDWATCHESGLTSDPDLGYGPRPERDGESMLDRRSTACAQEPPRIPAPEDPADVLRRELERSFAYTGTHHGSSRWSEFRRCPRGYHLRYDDGIRPAEVPDYFALGTLVHAALAYAGACERVGERAWRLADVFKYAQSRNLFPPDILVDAKRILGAYFAYWGRENAGYPAQARILEVEHLVASRVGGTRYTGRIDCLLEGAPKSGGPDRLVIVDHKTRRSMPRDDEATLIRRFSMRPQFMGLAYCLRDIERETPAFCVNILTKKRIPDFRRISWLYRDDTLDAWAREHSRMMEAGLDANWMNLDQCDPDFGAPCWARDWCHGSKEDRKKLYVRADTIARRRKGTKHAKAKANAKAAS